MFQTVAGKKTGCPPAERNRLSSSVRRQPAEPNGENKDQQNTDKKGRQRDPHE